MGYLIMDDRVTRVEETLRVIGGRWKPAIMFSLITGGTRRFSELQREIPAITQRMLTKQLRDLVAHGLVDRVFHEQVPPRVEYSATDLGRTLHPIYKAVCDWSDAHDAEVAAARARHPPLI
ncbi:MAG: helix-turn-helix domain-containing protein [Bauldia sp.]